MPAAPGTRVAAAHNDSARTETVVVAHTAVGRKVAVVAVHTVVLESADFFRYTWATFSRINE